MPVGPSTFDQHVSNAPIAGLCDAAPPDRRPSRPLAGYKAKKAHQLAWVLKSVNVADLSDKGDGYDKVYSSQSLERTNHWRQRKSRRKSAK